MGDDGQGNTSNMKTKILSAIFGAAVCAGTAAATAGVVLPVAMPSVIAAAGFAGALLGGFVSLSGFASVASNYNIRERAKGIALFAFFSAGIAVGVSTFALDRMVDNSLKDAATANFGTDWRGAKKDATLDVNIKLSDGKTIPVQATVVDSSFQVIAPKPASHPAVSRETPLKLKSCISFNISSDVKLSPRYATPIEVCKGRDLTSDEVGRVLSTAPGLGF